MPSSTSSPALALLESALAAFPCEKKMMFGCQVYFADGLMFAGVHNDRIFLRLSAADRGSFFTQHPDAAPFEPIAGRVVREYVTVPPAVAEERSALESWLERSYRYVESLEPKAPRGRKGGGD